MPADNRLNSGSYGTHFLVHPAQCPERQEVLHSSKLVKGLAQKGWNTKWPTAEGEHKPAHKQASGFCHHTMATIVGLPRSNGSNRETSTVIPGARHSPKCFIYNSSLILITILRRRYYYYYPHFIKVETNVKRGEVTCLRSPSWQGVRLGFSLAPEFKLLSRVSPSQLCYFS